MASDPVTVRLVADTTPWQRAIEFVQALLMKLFEDEYGPVCMDCCGSGREHVCGMGACVDLDTACPTCGGSGDAPPSASGL